MLTARNDKECHDCDCTEELKENVEETVRKAGNKVREIYNKAAHEAEDVKEDLEEAAYEAGRKARAYYDNANHEVRDATASVEKKIRKNPLAAGAIAAGAGFLLGLLFRRR